MKTTTLLLGLFAITWSGCPEPSSSSPADAAIDMAASDLRSPEADLRTTSTDLRRSDAAADMATHIATADLATDGSSHACDDPTLDPTCPINGAAHCEGDLPPLALGVSSGRLDPVRNTTVPGSCNSNGFYSLEVTTTSDLFLHTTVAPTTTTNFRGGLGYSIATACDPAAFENLNLDYTRFANCNFATPTEPAAHWARRLPPGNYVVAFGGQFEIPWTPMSTGLLDFERNVTLTPSPPPVCTGAPLLESGVTVTGETNETDTFFQTYPVYPSTDRVHRAELTARSRVRFESTSSSITNRVKIAVVTACDADLPPVLSAWTGEIAEGVLDAGSYYVVIESALQGQVPYTLTFTAEAAGLACASAPAIGGAGAMLSGNTSGKSDDFRGPENAIAGDDVYRLELATRTRVVTELDASYSHGKLIVYRGCGETFVKQTDFSGDPDVTLDAGVYYLVVDGALATSVGPYTLDVQLLPPS